MKRLSLSQLQTAFRIAMLTVFVLLVATLVAIDLRFSDLIIGDSRNVASQTILTRFDAAGLDRAAQDFTARQQRPYYPDAQRNPFSSPGTVAPPASVKIQ